LSLFIDASAMVAIIAPEPERDDLVARIIGGKSGFWSAMTGWETVSALRRSYRFTVEGARRELEQAVVDLHLNLVPIGHDELHIALDAYQRYGKGRHPARLNMGDCFAYACAKANGARLLYKGNDFAETDLA